MKHQYFVLTTSLWQGDDYSPVAVFPTRKQADAFADTKENNGINDYGQSNYSHVVKTSVLSKTEMERIGKICADDAHEEIARIESENVKSETAGFQI